MYTLCSPGEIENQICLFLNTNYLYVKTDIILLCSKRDGRSVAQIFMAYCDKGYNKGMLLVINRDI